MVWHQLRLQQVQDRQEEQRLVRRHTLPVLGDLKVQKAVQFGVGHAPTLPNAMTWATRQTIAGDRSY